jgi:2-polyprenyl-3-methyl-5-hydroxy-6-metoxy-1,4-benzoquinol methylase
MAAPSDRNYWNHNTAYHPWLVGIAAEHRGDVLDVGCGDGLLAQRLAPVSRSVTGIDPDPAAIGRVADEWRHISTSRSLGRISRITNPARTGSTSLRS